MNETTVSNIWIDQECIRIARFCERLDHKLGQENLEVVWEFILDFLRRRMSKCRIQKIHNELDQFLQTSFELRSRADFFIWALNFEEALTTLLRTYRTGVL
jgi:hypothetical protein